MGTLYPDWWLPAYGKATLATKEQKSKAETEWESWVEAHPAFVHYWYLAQYFREHDQSEKAIAALRKGVKYPLALLEQSDSMQPPNWGVTSNWAPLNMVFDATWFTYQQQEDDLVLEFAQIWEQHFETKTSHPSLDYLPFRAAAFLRLGKIDQAEDVVNRAIAGSLYKSVKHDQLFVPGRIYYARNLKPLQDAIMNQNQEFVYDPREKELVELFPEWQWVTPPEMRKGLQ